MMENDDGNGKGCYGMFVCMDGWMDGVGWERENEWITRRNGKGNLCEGNGYRVLILSLDTIDT